MEKKQEEKIKMMLPLLNEKQRRIYLATEAIGRPLESLMVIVNPFAATTTKNGLSIQCQLD